jgi:hypothetical protein
MHNPCYNSSITETKKVKYQKTYADSCCVHNIFKNTFSHFNLVPLFITDSNNEAILEKSHYFTKNHEAIPGHEQTRFENTYHHRPAMVSQEMFCPVLPYISGPTLPTRPLNRLCQHVNNGLIAIVMNDYRL